MNMRTLICVALSVFISIITLHPGKTDENGGHYDRSTGEYHYHHGYPAHQHINGVCPYDFDDRTGENSGSSSGSTRAKVEDTKKEKSVWAIIEDVFIILVWVYVAYKIIWDFIIAPRMRKTAQKKLEVMRPAKSVRSQEKPPAKTLPPPALPPPEKQTYTSPKPIERDERILMKLTEILEEKSSLTVFSDTPVFIDAIKKSIDIIPDDPDADEETMSHRILARSCYTVLSYRDKNSLSNADEPLSNHLLFVILRDSLLWLLHSKYYTSERYDEIVNTINVTLKRMNIKKPSSE